MALRTIANSDKFRDNVRGQFDKILHNKKNCLNLEKGIFNYTIKESERCKIVKKWDNKLFVQIYLNHLKSILTNLTEKWIEEINNGNIAPHKFAFMTHQELNNDKWAQLIDLKCKRDKNKCEINIAAATDTFTCRKCKNNKCTYYIQQVRSSDEPSTIFCQCVVCGNRWKTC